MMARFARVTAVMAAIGVGAVLSSLAPAGAVGPTTFSMSPTSGPAGTDVSVGGNGCAPGLLLSSSLDRVVVTMASAPPVSVQIPVTSSGAWSGTVSVPANAAAAPAAVTALCFTDGLQSLLTIYTPKTFTITATAAPGTTTPGPQTPTTTIPEHTHQPPVTRPRGTGPGSTPTTKPGGPRTTQPDGGGPTAGVPSGGSDGPGAGSSDGGSTNDGAGSSTGAEQTASAKRADTVAVAADLQAPDLNATGGSDGGSGLGWIGWLALLLLTAGVVAGALLFRRYRDEHAPIEA